MLTFNEDGFKLLNLILTQFSRCPIERLRDHVHCEISRMYIRNAATHQPLDLNGFEMFRGLYAFARRGLKAGQAFANFDG